MTDTLDPRVTPARPDLAAARLRGLVSAPRFVEPFRRRCRVGIAALRASPDDGAEQQTELLFGEDFDVYDEAKGWAWGQATRDSYVGYVRAEVLSELGPAPTHWVSAQLTYGFPVPNVKVPPRATLPLLAPLVGVEEAGAFLKTTEGLFVPRTHVREGSVRLADDPVAAALRFKGVPYLWGGRTAMGLDCSGLIQTALAAAGIAAPRDTDMQEAAVGKALPNGTSDLRRGDLIFWKGHVGWMLDEAMLLHANAHHMEVADEPLAQAVQRLEGMGLQVRSVRRL